MNSDIIQNDSNTRSLLVNYINELSKVTQNKNEVEVLENLKESLVVDCVICLDRDAFIYSKFLKYYSSSDTLTFGSFGLNHVVDKPDLLVSDLFKAKYKYDTIGYRTFYNLLSNNYKNQIYRIGILALNQKMYFNKMLVQNDYNNIMNENERENLEVLLENKDVLRINIFENENFLNLSTQLDYLIVFKHSNFRM